MTPSPTPSRARLALLSGAATAAYYATPDLVRSRSARGWVKVGLSAVTVAVSAPDLRAALAATRAERAALATARARGEDSAEGAADAPPVGGEAPTAVSTRGKVAAAALAAALVAVTVVPVVAAERWIFRRGEARAAAGVRLPHTRTGLLLGALSAAVALVPSPDTTDSTRGSDGTDSPTSGRAPAGASGA